VWSVQIPSSLWNCGFIHSSRVWTGVAGEPVASLKPAYFGAKAMLSSGDSEWVQLMRNVLQGLCLEKVKFQGSSMSDVQSY
jgi:hypothetical protein